MKTGTIMTMQEDKNYKKLKTGIDGLDSLLYGGVHLEEDSAEGTFSKDGDGGLLILARGVHGVNKVHLAMQMCEGLYLSMPGEHKRRIIDDQNKEDNNIIKKVLFISLNKHKERLRDTYIGFYLQRLINDFRIGKLDRSEFATIIGFFRWTKIDNPAMEFRITINEVNGIQNGAVFYDERTYCLCEKTANEEFDALCKINMAETAKYMNIGFIGRKDGPLYTEEYKEDTLASFNRLLNSLHSFYDNQKQFNGEENKYDCIMIDGLSRLTEEEIARCRFADLTDILRKMSKVGVITSDEKLSPTGISVDIIIEMVIHEEHHPDCLQNALKISKCLYQKHVYGWHSYKMRRTGIEVIPSLHFQMNSRFHMDDSVREAMLGYNQIPFELWTRERVGVVDDKSKGYQIPEGNDVYAKLGIGKLIALGVNMLDDGSCLIKKIGSLIEGETEETHLFFIDLSKSRTEFYKNYHKQIEEMLENHNKKIHLFNFRPGHIHDDDFLYTIEKQVRAIVRQYYKSELVFSDKPYVINEDKLKDYYKKIHLVIGDINYINFAYPCLNRDNMLLPAISNFTKKYHMTNFVYTTASLEIPILDKEKELYQQLKMVSNMLF